MLLLRVAYVAEALGLDEAEEEDDEEEEEEKEGEGDLVEGEFVPLILGPFVAVRFWG